MREYRRIYSFRVCGLFPPSPEIWEIWELIEFLLIRFLEILILLRMLLYK